MSHNTITKAVAAVAIIGSIGSAYVVGSHRPGPAPVIKYVDRPVIVEKRVEVPVPSPTPTKTTVPAVKTPAATTTTPSAK